MNLMDNIQKSASAQYRSYTSANREEQSIGDFVLLYSKETVAERNDTYEVQKYLPGWFTIGDDGGGRAVLMRLDGTDDVYLCDHGAIGSIAPERIAASFSAWVADECPLPDDD